MEQNENRVENSEIMETTEMADNSATAIALANTQSLGLAWNDVSQMKFQYKMANALAQGNSIPERFKNKPCDILIGMDIAIRAGQPLSMILNNMYSVYGQIGWSGQYAIMAINACKKFSPLKFVFNADNTSCYAQATRLADGEILKSEVISLELARKEGWLDKNGSKWKVYPQQMMRYRSASFFARAYCPEVLYGYQTQDEIQDTYGYTDYTVEDKTVTIELNKENNNG